MNVIVMARKIAANDCGDQTIEEYELAAALLRAVEALEWYARQYYVFCKENHSPCDTADIVTQDHGKRARECLASLGVKT